MTTSFTLTVPAQLWTVNAAHRMHHHERGRWTRAARELAEAIARSQKVPTFAWLTVEVAPLQAKGKLADVAAHVLVAKAVVDGLVDAKVITDDTPDIVRAVTFLPPERAAQDGLRLTLTGDLT